jgi:hypothetical protein
MAQLVGNKLYFIENEDPPNLVLHIVNDFIGSFGTFAFWAVWRALGNIPDN